MKSKDVCQNSMLPTQVLTWQKDLATPEAPCEYWQRGSVEQRRSTDVGLDLIHRSAMDFFFFSKTAPWNTSPAVRTRTTGHHQPCKCRMAARGRKGQNRRLLAPFRSPDNTEQLRITLSVKSPFVNGLSRDSDLSRSVR